MLTLYILIRRRVLQSLIWVYTVRQGPCCVMIGIYGLSIYNVHTELLNLKMLEKNLRAQKESLDNFIH